MEPNAQEQIEVLKWLFGDEIQIEQEQDITLAPYYEDINIYYTKEIYDLFQTEVLKREEKIIQVGSEIFFEPNVYHNRLEHSKGAYRNMLQFLSIQYRKPEWRKYIETNKLKGYLVEKLKFMCIHDIGHSTFSHSIENLIGDKNCTHEDIGGRILQENEELKQALNKIKAKEQNSNLQGDGSLECLCEGNIDFDRMDFSIRDRIYIGRNFDYETILKLHSMCDLQWVEEAGKYQYVYRPEALKYVVQFLNERYNMYETEYASHRSKLEDKLMVYIVEQAKEGKIGRGKLQGYLNNIVGKKLEDINLNDFLKINDITFLNAIMNDEETMKNNEALQYIMQNNQTLLQIAIGLLNPQNTNYSEYSEEEKQFINNVKKLINEKRTISPKKIEDVIISVELNENKQEEIKEKINKILGEKNNGKLIHEYESKLKKYNKEEPIYIKDEKDNIYALDKFPSLQVDLSTKYKYASYLIVPELKENGVSDEQIEKIKEVLKQYREEENEKKIEKEKTETNRMNMFRTDHNEIDYARKMDEFFGEGR